MSRSDVLKVDDLWLQGRVNFAVSLKWFDAVTENVDTGREAGRCWDLEIEILLS